MPPDFAANRRGGKQQEGSMRISKWMLALVALLACGLIAAGCGDDEEDSGSDEPAATEESSDSSSDSGSSGATVDADAFLAECEETAEGTPAEQTAATVCQEAADALESCGEQAEQAGGDEAAVEAAIKACQDTADAAVEQLEAVNP
jgi:hypothetical protein